MSNDGFLNIGLPNTHAADAIFWDTIRINQSCMYGKSTGRSGQVAAVTTPVNEGFIDRHLAVKIICIVIGLAAFRQDDTFAGARSGATHAIGVLGIRVWTANHSHEKLIASSAGCLRVYRQIFKLKKHTLARTATHIGGSHFNLCSVRHDKSSLRVLEIRHKYSAIAARVPLLQTPDCRSGNPATTAFQLSSR